MSTALTEFNAQVDVELSGVSDTEFASDSRDAMIKKALERYARDRPGEPTDDIDGDGGRYYALSGLDGWDDDFSGIVKVEWDAKAVSEDDVPAYLEDDDFGIYDDGTNKYVVFAWKLQSGKAARVKYTVPYAFSGSPKAVDTPTTDFYAICALAAALCCQALAAKYGQLGDSTISADVVDYRTKSEQYARRAKEFVAQYETHMGIGEKAAVSAAGTVVDWDKMTTEGRDYLFHRRRQR